MANSNTKILFEDEAPSSGAFQGLTNPFRRFFELESASGILLMFCAAGALILANSPVGEAFVHFWHLPIGIKVGAAGLQMGLSHWINDALMAMFFFVVGLEIKRELATGELSSFKTAALPVAGALGGMIVPALIYAAFNHGGPASHGWGIPTATDIAFAIAVLGIVGKRVPLGAKVFLTALAIADDIGAVLVIALFYTSRLSIPYLAAGFILLAVLFWFNWLRFRRIWIYMAVGGVIWFCFLKSGVHSTIAGVLLAFTIPSRVAIDTATFRKRGRYLLERLEAEDEAMARGQVPTYEQRASILGALEDQIEKIQPPAQRLEHVLQPFVVFGIMPMFAFANAGVHLNPDSIRLFFEPVSLGVLLGLFLGKQLGIFGVSWLSIKLGLAAMPRGVSWGMLYGVACLGGIGFTMSLFVTTLAFKDQALVDAAKLAIFAASIGSALFGMLILKLTASKAKAG